MRNDHSAPILDAENRIISPAPADVLQDRAARRTSGWRFGPLLYWLAAFFVVVGPLSWAVLQQQTAADWWRTMP